MSSSSHHQNQRQRTTSREAGRGATDGSIFSTNASLRRVTQSETVAGGGGGGFGVAAAAANKTTTKTTSREEKMLNNVRVKEHAAKEAKKMIRSQHREQLNTNHHHQQQREMMMMLDERVQRDGEEEDAPLSAYAFSSQRTDAATLAGSAVHIRDDYYVDAKWNNGDDYGDNNNIVNNNNNNNGYGAESEEEEFTFRSASVGESVRSELENARRASANTIADAAMMMASTSSRQQQRQTGVVDVIRRDVDDTIDDTVANLLEMIENERLKSSAYEKNLERTEKAYLETKKESEEIAERLTGAANIISELKSALVHAMREHHDDEKFEDDVNDAVNETRMRRGGSGSDLSNSIEAVGARRWEAKLRRTVSSALERFTSEARGVPNGDALYRAAKEALDPVVASAIAGVVDEVEIASGKKNKKNKEDKDYFRADGDVNNSYSLDDDDDTDYDDDDEPTNRSREHEQDINSLDGRAKLVAWMQMEKAKRKRLTRKLLKTKDELAKSEASRMAATRRWLEAASQLESERGSQFTQSVAGDGMGSSSDEEGLFDDDESDDDQGFTPRSIESRKTDPGQRARARKTQSLDGSGDAALFFMQTSTSPSSMKGVRRRKSKSASASLVDPSSPSKNYGTFSPFTPGSGTGGPKSALSKRSSSSNRKNQNRKSRLGFEDRIEEEDEEEGEEEDEKRSAVRSLDVSAEIQKTIQTVTGNPTFRDVARTIAATLEQFAASPTFELVWPICFVTFLVFWRSSAIAFHANAALERQREQRVLTHHPSVARVPAPPPLLREEHQRQQHYRRPATSPPSAPPGGRFRRPTSRVEEENGDEIEEEETLSSHEKAPLPDVLDSSEKERSKVPADRRRTHRRDRTDEL
jgi:hypothetical protein